MPRTGQFDLQIETGNNAFRPKDADGDEGPELVRILRDVADRIERGGAGEDEEIGGYIYDVNGNRVGSYGLARGLPA